MRSLRFVNLCWLLLIVACGLLPGNNNLENEFCAEPRELIQDFGHITLPASYAQLEVRCSVFVDNHTVYARFDFAPADLEAFQQSTLIDEWHDSSGTPPDFPYSFGTFLDEPGIARLPAYTYGLYTPQLPVSQQILIDTSNAQRLVVYFVAFTSY
mgnify:CR=1 FL=1